MDEVMFTVENPSNELHEVPVQIFTDERKNLSYPFQSPMLNKLPLKSKKDKDGPSNVSTQRILSKMQQKSLQQGDIHQQSETVHDLSSLAMKPTTKIEPETICLLECIKLHQASIK
jgi:hypothetical protein